MWVRQKRGRGPWIRMRQLRKVFYKAQHLSVDRKKTCTRDCFIFCSVCDLVPGRQSKNYQERGSQGCEREKGVF